MAIGTLRQKGVDAIVHLGDICDSLEAEKLDEALQLISENAIHAVKGNNDYLIESALVEKYPHRFLPETRSFLKALPIKIEWDGVCFSHSLPFDFLRSFYEPIDNGTVDRARDLFLLTSYKVLFAGHSHTPAMFHWNNGDVLRRHFEKHGPFLVPLDPNDRYIIIVGAVTRGECGLYDRARRLYERIQFLGRAS